MHKSTWIVVLMGIATVAMMFVMTRSCERGRFAPRPERVAPVPRVPMPGRDSDAPYHGIDISSHQSMIDWEKVTRDDYIKFVYIKASEGATYTSPHYGYNVSMARRRGLLVGSYHYFTSSATVREQFDNFVRLAAASTQDLIPMIDVETRGTWSRRQLCDSLQVMADMLERHYGVKPMIYSTMSFYNDNLAPMFNNYPLYIGRYSDEPPAISWDGNYVIWQYSQTGVVPGIDAYVDLALFANGRWLDDILLTASRE